VFGIRGTADGIDSGGFVGTLVQSGCRSREVLRVCREQRGETPKTLGQVLLVCTCGEV